MTARASWVGTAAFALAFPGFFAYHTLVDRGLVPRALGGYSTAMALLLLPPLALEYRHRVLRDGALPRFDAAFFGFAALFALVTAGHLAIGTSAETAQSHLSSALQFVSLFLAIRVVDVRSEPFRKTLLVSFVLVTALAFWNTTGESVLRATLDFTVRDDRSPDYQGYGLVYMVLLLFLAGTIRSAWTRAACYAVAVPALFVNGARSEFAAIFVGIATVEFCRARRRRAFALLLAGATALILVGAAAIGGALGELVPRSRVLALVSGEADDSALERLRFFWRAWATVADSPFLGSFASYPVGEYAHNALSAWVDLGLLGFAYFVGLLVIPLVVLLRHLGEDSRTPEYLLAIEFAVILFILSAVAKDFTYRLFPMTMALYATWREPSQGEDGGADPGAGSACQAKRIP